MMWRAFFVTARVVLFFFYFFTSLVCILVHTPFTFTHVIDAGIFPWLHPFLRIHHWFILPVQGLALATLWPDLRSTRRSRWLLLSYAACSIGAAVGLALHPILPTLRPDARSFLWSQLALLPLLVLAAIDHDATRGKVKWKIAATREDASVFRAAALCLLVTFVTYSATFHFRAADSLGLSSRDELTALLWSLLLHASFVGAAFVLWNLSRGLAGFARTYAGVSEYVLVVVMAILLVAAVALNMVFASISLKGPFAVAAALSWGLVMAVTSSALALRGAAARGTAVESGLRLFLSPLAPTRAPLWVRRTWILALAALAVQLQVAASAMDVNGLNQRLCASLVWVLLFAGALAAFPPRTRTDGNVALYVALACVGALAYRTWRVRGRPADSAALLDKLSASEPSFGLLSTLAGSGAKSESLSALNDFMQRNTSFSHDTPIAPLDIRMVGDLTTPIPGIKPHVFIFVVDSLRRDYVSAYNPKVTFTPSLDRFAKANDVFTNAFTHYGATGLSEPSIWVGGMMPHKQYITPFQPMNSLEKLLLAENYVRFISVDSILGQLLDRGPSLVPLDEHTVPGDYDLCASLTELRSRLDSKRHQDLHFFAYTQPQNIHVSRIAREGTNVLGGEHYPGFYDPYASRLRRIDECFGSFIDYLQAENLYDESVVVFTADHGDLLGEEGRWGHAYNLNPEVVRIPLLIHRPKRLRDQAVDTNAVAFSTDIAPSIYRLLGYMPASLGAGFGQSLYGPRTPDREWHMLVSSYGPVYGILEETGHRLYVADAVNYTEAYYDVAAGSTPARDPVSEEVRNRNAPRIMAGVKELHDTFHMESGVGGNGSPVPGSPVPSASAASPR